MRRVEGERRLADVCCRRRQPLKGRRTKGVTGVGRGCAVAVTRSDQRHHEVRVAAV